MSNESNDKHQEFMEEFRRTLGDNNALLDSCITVLSDLKKDSVVLKRSELIELLKHVEAPKIIEAADSMSFKSMLEVGLEGLSNDQLYRIVKHINQPK